VIVSVAGGWRLNLMKPPFMKRSSVIIALIFAIGISCVILFAEFSSKAVSKKNNFTRRAPIALAEELADSTPLPDSLATFDTLLVAHKSTYRMGLYAKGKLLKTYFIALGQEPLGHKTQQGDNHTPEGVYKIIQKARGPFEGAYAAYLGVAWMRLNYPNNADAINGFKKGLITEAQKNAIINANNAGKEPPKNTKLGGGIGIHGWNGSWPGDDQQNLTWGCISMQNPDLDELYKRVPVGTTIVIWP
jgi:murein L,D-transpeptidase YafK